MKRMLVVAIILCAAYSINTYERSTEPEFVPLFINPYIQMEIFGKCKQYAEAVYADLLMGMNMTHPEADGKEATAAEFAKEAFLACFKPYKET